jgi:two-component system alkaline phosphatase synthesis response regulator PhoP
MAKKRILVVEDDAAVRRGILDALRFHGFDVLEAEDAESGMQAAVRTRCDLLVLDLVLPGGDGLDILRRVRETRPTLPVIILTARGSESDRVAGLRLGADDYVVKPFSVKELLARVDAVLRRSAERGLDVDEVDVPGGRVHFGRREVQFDDGTRAELTEREAEVLRYFARNPGRVIARDEMLSSVWRVDPRWLDTRTVDMHVARLREKLRDDPGHPRVILTVRGKGYMLGQAEQAP